MFQFVHKLLSPFFNKWYQESPEEISFLKSTFLLAAGFLSFPVEVRLHHVRHPRVVLQTRILSSEQKIKRVSVEI